MIEKTATIIGATGLIGSILQAQLLQDPYYDRVRALVRRPEQLQEDNPKSETKLVNFEDTEWLKLALDGSDAVFCCIGTTQKKMGRDKNAYWKIDHDIPVNACKLARETGCEKFIMVSAIGADAKSGNFYIRMKGQTEADVIATGMPIVHIMQPSLLLGKRTEKRPLEKFSQVVFKPVSQLMFGSLSKYRAIEADTVAKAMITASKSDEQGIFRHTYDGIMALAKQDV
ncbi:MAG: NAD(P)H-binding protein [Niabella sp.]